MECGGAEDGCTMARAVNLLEGYICMFEDRSVPFLSARTFLM